MVYTVIPTHYFIVHNIISIFTHLTQQYYDKTIKNTSNQKHLKLRKSYFLTKK